MNTVFVFTFQDLTDDALRVEDGVMSIHLTENGANDALEAHKSALRVDYDRHVVRNSNIKNYEARFPFGKYYSWDVTKFDLLP